MRNSEKAVGKSRRLLTSYEKFVTTYENNLP